MDSSSGLEEMALTSERLPGEGAEDDYYDGKGIRPRTARIIAARVMEPAVTVEQVEALSDESAVVLLEAMLGCALADA